MKLGYILFIVLLILILLFVNHVLFLSNSYHPYNSTSVFGKEYPYEGFVSFPSFMSEPTASPSVRTTPPTHLAVSPVTSDSYYQGSDFNAPEKPLDLFSHLKGSQDCVGSSAGLHNSTGGLCLSGDAMKALKTRGGNQSLPIM